MCYDNHVVLQNNTLGGIFPSEYTDQGGIPLLMGEDYMQCLEQDQQQGNVVFTDPISSQMAEKALIYPAYRQHCNDSPVYYNSSTDGKLIYTAIHCFAGTYIYTSMYTLPISGVIKE